MRLALHLLPIVVAVACNFAATAFAVARARRLEREWVRVRAINQIVWAYSKELLEMGVTLPPRCCLCCEILPRHVEGCLMEDRRPMRELEKLVRVKYYPDGEYPPHPEEEEPPSARKAG